MFARNAAETFVTWSLAASFVSMVIKTYFEYFAASEGRNKFVHRDSIKLWNENESCDESHLDELEKIDDPVGSPRALGGASIGPADR